jgi:hypothetical protein
VQFYYCNSFREIDTTLLLKTSLWFDNINWSRFLNLHIKFVEGLVISIFTDSPNITDMSYFHSSSIVYVLYTSMYEIFPVSSSVLQSFLFFSHHSSLPNISSIYLNRLLLGRPTDLLHYILSLSSSFVSFIDECNKITINIINIIFTSPSIAIISLI